MPFRSLRSVGKRSVRGKEEEMELFALLAAVTAMVLLDVVAISFGHDSRDLTARYDDL